MLDPDSDSSDDVAGNVDADTDSPDDELVVEEGEDKLVERSDLDADLLLLLSLTRDLSSGVTSRILRQFSASLIILTTSP